MNTNDDRENCVPFSWIIVFLITIAITLGIGVLIGEEMNNNAFQRGLEAGVRINLGHPENRSAASN